MSQDGAETSLRHLRLRPGSSWAMQAAMGVDENQTAEPERKAAIHFPLISTFPREMPVSELLVPGSLRPWGARGLVLRCWPCSALGLWGAFWLRNELCR